MHVRRWTELSSRQQTVVLVAVPVQLSLAATTYADLVTRPARRSVATEDGGP